MIDSKWVRGLIACSSWWLLSGSVQAADGPPPGLKTPPAECLAVLDRLSKDVPVAESGPALKRQGLLIRSPIIVPESAITETDVVSAARLRVKIDQLGNVVPDSVTVQQAIGDPKLPLVLSQAVPSTLSFDVSGAFSVPKEFAFTTVYVVCAKK